MEIDRKLYGSQSVGELQKEERTGVADEPAVEALGDPTNYRPGEVEQSSRSAAVLSSERFEPV
jgi:hypothetical protein